MKKTRRITAVVLAVLTVLGSFFAVTASAATVSITFDYCYDTAGNIIKFKQKITDDGYTVGTEGEELCRIYADGKDAYCIEPGRTLISGNKLDSASSKAWSSLSEGQRTAVNLAILYGKGGSSDNLGGTQGQQWIATQLIVWEIVTGCRKTTGTFACTNTKYIESICKSGSNPGVRSIYNKISNALSAHLTLPSFAKVTKSSAPTHQMTVASGKYTLKLTDTNKILSEFNFKKTGDVSVSKSGNTLTLSSSKPVDSAVSFSSAKSLPAVSSTSSIVAYGSTSLQDVVKGVGKPDLVNAYFKVVAFDKGMEAMMAMKKEYKKRRDFLVSRINEMDKISCIMPKGAFYVFANIKKTGLSAEEFAERLLEKEHVAVIPGSNFSKNASGYVRISYGTSMEKIEDGLNRMERFLKSL